MYICNCNKLHLKSKLHNTTCLSLELLIFSVHCALKGDVCYRPMLVQFDVCLLLVFASLYRAVDELPVLTVVNKRKAKFLTNYLKSCNSLCIMFAHVAQNELKDLPSCTTAST